MIYSSEQKLQWFPDYETIDNKKAETIAYIMFMCGTMTFEQYDALNTLKRDDPCELSKFVVCLLKQQLSEICDTLSFSNHLFKSLHSMMESIGHIMVTDNVIEYICKRDKKLIVLSSDVLIKIKLDVLDSYINSWIDKGYEIMVPFSIIEKFDELKIEKNHKSKELAFTSRKVLRFIHQKILDKKIIQEKCYNYDHITRKHNIKKTCRNLVLLSAKRFQQKDTYNQVVVLHFYDNVLENNANKMGVQCMNFVDFSM